MRFFVLSLILLMAVGASAAEATGPKEELLPLPKKEPAKEADTGDSKEPPTPEPAEGDLKLLSENGVDTSNATLLAYFRRRTLAESNRPRIQELVTQLAAPEYRRREQAMEELVKWGPSVLEFLRRAARAEDLELVRRAEQCIARIRSADHIADVTAAAVRILEQRRPAEVAAVLLGFLPYADSEYVADEVRTALARMAVDGPPPELVTALKEPMAVRRAAAAEALASVKARREDVRGLLKDADPLVRLRAAQGLIVAAQDRSAVPVLIEAAPLVSNVYAWPAEDLLLRIADGRSPPIVRRGADAEAHKKFQAAWLAWWTQHERDTDLAKLSDRPKLLGHTIVVLLDQGQVVELDAENKTLWTIDGLELPLDVQVLPSGNVLVAEYNGGRVTERDRRGQIRWEKVIPEPLMAQRLSNRHTFIATATQFFEFDEKGTEVFSFTAPGGERYMKVAKLPNGEIAALTTEARVVRLDDKGKELNSFGVNLQTRLYGGRIHMLPNGRVLVPLNAENKVVEYDAQGQSVWEVSVPQPVAAVRLPNGNTLVTTMQPQTGALEFDRNGREVWHYRHHTRVTRALRH